MNPYISAYLNSEGYREKKYTDEQSNWEDFPLLDRMIFSRRDVYATKENFEDLIHSHEFYELIFYIEGELSLISENKLYPAAANSAFISSPNELHGGRLLAPSLYSRYVLWFDESIFEDLGKAGYGLLDFVRNRNSGENNFILSSEENRHKLRSYLDHMQDALTTGHPRGEILAYSYLLRFFILLGECAANPVTIPSFTDDVPFLSKVLAYIDQNFATIRSIDEIADHVHLSNEYLSRSFTRHVGIPISDYLRKKRISYSKELLLAGVSVTEACYSAGYNNLSHFIKCFRENTGMTPAKYAKSMVRESR